MSKRIEARGLTKRYGDKIAVDDLTFSVEPGRVTGFLGPNGAGKSTTMRLVLGLDSPTAGTVTVSGRRYADLVGPAHAVGALLDARAVHPGRTAANHLLAVAQTAGIGRKRVDEVLGEVGLANVAGRRAGTFSLGMSQRLGIAAALLGDPPVLMFDEPVNGLDPEGIRWIRTLMRDLAAEGRTVLVSSHLMSEMALTAQHLLVIGRGRLIADTDIEDFLRTHGTESVLVRSAEPDRLARLLRRAGADLESEVDALVVSRLTAREIGKLAAAEGIALSELHPRRGSLEDVFMALTNDAVEYGVPA
ncbi:ABC transporter ATP-binding protein [Actinophytocola algeriensis]|uniref:ABC-2 type transport system ATP-binding protein n=1 Tax=Actinophytocola algeriensis TaxID=1768010 RepID=A0A7W7Q2B7_9PSEU|nr:ATP-binding cassette domain-containing protein [Actinophytocola algeriensis]MBB4905603.1 ABC-2 type transport system ATP-binding protein [Actinophytocola algeriensis]MBE1472712.1 ABC-2 type transport system ATP-binding protein [Actinophytocola algeriensis]